MKSPFAVLFSLAAALTLAANGPARAQLPGLPLGNVPIPSVPVAPPSAPRIPPAPAFSPPSVAAPSIAPPAFSAPRAALPQISAASLGGLSAISAAPGLNGGPASLVLSTSGLGTAADLARAANARLAEATGLVDFAAPAVVEAVGSYRQQARDLIRRHRDLVEADDQGRAVVRGEIAGLGVTAQALARAEGAGFRVTSQETIAGLGLAAVLLAPPRGMSAREAVRRLRTLDPAGQYDFNHIYFESGAVAGPRPAPAVAAASAASGRGARVGLVDGSASAETPALARAAMVQRAFAPGGARVTAHATAVASLLAGSAADFRGAAPGATLYVADVYGPTPAGGSALSVVRALGWLAEQRTPVINISLVGPPNALLASGVAALVAKGHVVVAAVGNDGPGAAPLYPAAYPGVVAVTGVDARRRVLPEAGRGAYVGFAAPGSDMTAAGLDGGLVAVRGTSFAAPLAAGRLSRLISSPDPAAAQRAIAALGGEASDLGAPGRDPVYGRGLVAFDLAVRPAATLTAGR